MANPHRGEVTLQVGARTYTLRCGMNALAELEDALGLPVHKLWRRWSENSVGVKELRAMFWAFAKEAHPELTLTDAGNLMDGVRREDVTAAVLRAVKLGFPSANSGNGQESDADPPKAAGSGTSS